MCVAELYVVKFMLKDYVNKLHTCDRGYTSYYFRFTNYRVH